MAQESSSKRAREDLQQEFTKKQNVDDDKEKEDLKQCFEIVQDDEVVIDAIPLATKPPMIVDFQIHTKGKQGYYEIIRADGSSKIYLGFSQLLKEFNREDLKILWRLVKAKHGNTRPEEAYERVLWGDLKVMFKPDIENKKYPLTPATITTMLNKKLQADHWNEMCYQLLKLMTKLVKNPGSGRIVGIKRLLEVAAAKVRVTAAKHNLVLFVILVKNMLSS
ncbi:hypothetical protein Tco_1442411 [Tanacetum coccineum]